MQLETAKKLKKVADKFGVELPESKSVYAEEILRCGYYQFTGDWYKDDSPASEYAEDKEYKGHYCPIYTTDELLEWLPASVMVKKYVYILKMKKFKNDYFSFGYFALSDRYIFLSHCNANTPSKALALLAIELIKNKIIK